MFDDFDNRRLTRLTRALLAFNEAGKSSTNAVLDAMSDIKAICRGRYCALRKPNFSHL